MNKAEIERWTQEAIRTCLNNLWQEVRREDHDWYCGCDHWNGCNLAVCARCGRNPNGDN